MNKIIFCLFLLSKTLFLILIEFSLLKITDSIAVKLADCVYNDSIQRGGTPPFTDMDNDGSMENGGFDLNEYYSEDSIYYNPSKFYKN